jgi:hypothetical protein
MNDGLSSIYGGGKYQTSAKKSEMQSERGGGASKKAYSAFRTDEDGKSQNVVGTLTIPLEDGVSETSANKALDPSFGGPEM